MLTPPAHRRCFGFVSYSLMGIWKYVKFWVTLVGTLALVLG